MTTEKKISANIDPKSVEALQDETEEKDAKKPFFDEKRYFQPRLEEGKKTTDYTIRILPISAESNEVCAKIKIHSMKVSPLVAQSGFKSFICINDHNAPNYKPEIKCPLCQKAEYYFAKAKETEKSAETAVSEEEKNNILEESKKIKVKAYNHRANENCILRLIDRGRESEGPKFWRTKRNKDKKDPFSLILNIWETRNKESLQDNGEGYNVFDLVEGKDFKLTAERVPATGGQKKDGMSITVVDGGNRKPLSKDVDLANQWINDTTKWQDIYAKRDYDYLAVVAEGLIPYWERSVGHYVGYKPEDFGADKKPLPTAKPIFDPLSTESTPQPISSQQVQPTEEVEELPF